MIHGWWWDGRMSGAGLFAGFLMFLFAIAAVILVVWLSVRLLHSASRKSAPAPGTPQLAQPDPVLETLRRRLAEGAITIQEFDELKQKLGV